MAGFTLKFDAETSGNYKIGYRDSAYPSDSYKYKEVYVNNTSYPHEVSVSIEVEGNLYCADVIYEGWILPMCFGEVYQPGQDVPDNATTFVHTVQQISNNCSKLKVTLQGFGIASVTITDPGGGYTEAPAITLIRDVADTNVDDAILVPVIESGKVTAINVQYAGTYNGVPTLSIAAPGSGTQATAVAVLEINGEDIPTEDIANFACSSVNGTTNIVLDTIGTYIQMCGNYGTAQNIISKNYKVENEGCCYCESCCNVTIDATSATSGSVEYSYNKCWDESGVTTYFAELQHGQSITLNNVILDTVYTFGETLDVSAVITHD